MYAASIRDIYASVLQEIRSSGLYKEERIIESPQSSQITANGRSVLNFCANNYLGLSNNPDLIAAAKRGLDRYGMGLSSVRFICGTQTLHKDLEQEISKFHSKDDAILYAACFDANGGLFEPLLDSNDAVISDALNHASVIDGIRLCKAKRFRYQHSDMDDLKHCLKQAREGGAQKIMVATDGVFSMDGDVGKLSEICTLAERYDAMVMVDESHASGFFGPTGRGASEYCGVLDRVDIITSTLGKALGGAVGGFTTGHQEIIELLRQRSRPYLFSNSLSPAIVAAGTACLQMLNSATELRDILQANTKYFRAKVVDLGFSIKGDVHPIVPIMLGDAQLATNMSEDLLNEGIYVIGFSYPVVPKGEARIRCQVSAAHSREDLDRTLEAFEKVGRKHGVIG